MDFFQPLLENETFVNTLLFVWNLYPIWLPLMLLFWFWDAWFAYIRADFFAKQKYVLLDIRLPQIILKTPAAMETVIASLYDTSGEGDFISKYWEGKTRPWFSLELASIGGEVKFFIWAREGLKDFIESLIYSQYHEAEIHVVDDYTKSVHFDPKEIDLWACDFKLDKADVFPIKTYIDYALEKEAKEELGKVDPLTPVLEYLGSLGKDEQAWFQIVIRAHKKEIKVENVWPTVSVDFDKSPLGIHVDTSDVSLYKKVDWTVEAKEEIEKILKKIKDKENKTVRQLTEGEKETIVALERSISKPAFDTGIRAIYLAKKSAFKKSNQGNLTACLRQFNSSMQALKANKKTAFDYPWQDFLGKKMIKSKQKFLKLYKKRAFFYNPHKANFFVMNAEELATMWHFPGAVATTPNLTRIPSKKAQAPTNLPI